MRQRLKRLYSLQAIPSWIIILWKIAEVGDTMSAVIGWLSPAWQFLSSPFGTILLLIIGFGVLIWLVVKPEGKKTRASIQQSVCVTKVLPSWFEEVIESDKASLGSRIYWREYSWHWDGLKRADSYIELTLTVINATCFPILVAGVSGRFQIMGQECSVPIEKEGKTRISHGSSAGIRIRQWLSPDMMNLIVLNSEKIEISLKGCQLTIETEVPDEQSEQTRISIGTDHVLVLPKNVGDSI